MVANSARGQVSRENVFFPCPHSRPRIWSRETGSAVPSRVSMPILYERTEKEWTDCVQSDVWVFGIIIAGHCKATSLEAKVRVKTVAEGGRRFMAAWRKKEVDAARHRQEKREVTRPGKLKSYTEV